MSNFTTNQVYPLSQSQGVSVNNGEILLDQGTNELVFKVAVPGSESFASASLQFGSKVLTPKSQSVAGGVATIKYDFLSDEGGDGPSDGENAVFTITFEN